MISLLQKTHAFLNADRIALGRRSASLLEWPRITDQVAVHCRNRLAADAVRARLPFASLEAINLYRDLADELRSEGDAGRWPPLVEVSDEDFTRARDILTAEVLPEWAERAGGDWAARWNDSVGKVVGVEIK